MQNRLIAAVLLLFIPYIVKLILNIASIGGGECVLPETTYITFINIK